MARKKRGRESERRKEKDPHCLSTQFLYPLIFPFLLPLQQSQVLVAEVKPASEIPSCTLPCMFMSVYRWEQSYITTEDSNAKDSGSLPSEAQDVKGTEVGVEGEVTSRATSWRLQIHSIFRYRSCLGQEGFPLIVPR